MPTSVEILQGLEGQLDQKLGEVTGLQERAENAANLYKQLQQYLMNVQSNLLGAYSGSAQKYLDLYNGSITPGVALVNALLANEDTRENGEKLRKQISAYKQKIDTDFKPNAEEELRLQTYILSQQLAAAEAKGKTVHELSSKELFEQGQ